MVKYIKLTTKTKSKSVFAMAFPRKVVLDSLYENASKLNDHILKVVLYRDIRKDSLHHWLHDEISVWLSRATELRCRSKIKPRDYKDNLFGFFGTDKYDSLCNLRKFSDKYCSKRSKDPYPEFEITDELVNRVYNTYQKFIDTCLPILMQDRNVSVNEWYEVVKSIFEV